MTQEINNELNVNSFVHPELNENKRIISLITERLIHFHNELELITEKEVVDMFRKCTCSPTYDPICTECQAKQNFACLAFVLCDFVESLEMIQAIMKDDTKIESMKKAFKKLKDIGFIRIQPKEKS